MIDSDITNFKMVVADWGSANVGGTGVFSGGTPVYAGPNTFNIFDKDLFSFGRLAMELMMDKTGIGSIFLYNVIKFTVANLILKFGWGLHSTQSKIKPFALTFDKDYVLL